MPEEKMGENKIKRVFRLRPCPAWDVEGMESWLGDMAQEGLLLSAEGFFLGFAIFEETTPRVVKYRLEAARERAGMWGENGGAPDGDAVALNAKYGWEYVAAHGQFYIYRAEGAKARELNTDPRVQALAIDAVRRRERAAVVTCFAWMVLYPLIYLRGTVLLTMLAHGTWFVLSAVLLLLWVFAKTLARALQLGKLRRRLCAGQALDHGKAWRKKAALYRAGSLALAVCILAWLGVLLGRWNAGVLNADAGEVPLAEYAGEAPFATLADLVGGGEYRLESFAGTNAVRQWEDVLAPLAMEWKENATIALPGGGSFSGGLYIDYYEAASPWLAREIAREYLRADRFEKRYEPLELPSLNVDYAAAYRLAIFPVVILQKGNTVLRAMFYQYDSSAKELPLADWARMMAQRMK